MSPLFVPRWGHFEEHNRQSRAFRSKNNVYKMYNNANALFTDSSIVLKVLIQVVGLLKLMIQHGLDRKAQYTWSVYNHVDLMTEFGSCIYYR